VVLVGEDPASEVYVRNKGQQTVEVGMASFEHRLSDQTTERELLVLIDQLNSDPTVHGILVQLPLPAQINTHAVINAIDPDKDVDGFHLINVGRLTTGESGLVPCTPLGCMMLLRAYAGDLSGQNAVIVGRSNIVGKPMAALLLPTDIGQIFRARMCDCHRTVRRQEQSSHRLTDNIRSAHNHRILTRQITGIRTQQHHTAQRGAGDQSRFTRG
jgi:methylenetetrahydrofolate dehydrogenase (NADP+)/methenyltetrahydrofolate cyclohydrolase